MLISILLDLLYFLRYSYTLYCLPEELYLFFSSKYWFKRARCNNSLPLPGCELLLMLNVKQSNTKLKMKVGGTVAYFLGAFELTF